MPDQLQQFIKHPESIPLARVIAFDTIGPVSWADILKKSTAWRKQLRSTKGRYIVVQLPKGDDFLACLLAVWSENKVAVLYTSELRDISSGSVSRNISPVSTGINQPQQQTTVYELDQFNPEVNCNAQDVALVLFTSGSSGVPVGIAKSFSQLDVELELIELLWGETVNRSVCCSTVSRQHMYGLPFALLWPLVCGRPFFTEIIHHIQSLEPLSARFPITLITSPVQLENLPDNLEWENLRPRIAAIFSAGASLPEKAAVRCKRLLKVVTEIYGSTETGAVAWRDQTTQALWQCLPGISIATDPQTQQLQICSPCLPGGAEQKFEVADRATSVSPSSFELLGRSDRIAKVGGKRISLTQVEACLSSHPWVEEVKTVLLAQRKSRIGAVVVLSQEGRGELIDQGRQHINRALSAHLVSQIEAVAIPRYWRYVGRIPVNIQGKSSAALLAALFDEEQQLRLPEILDRCYQPGSSEGQFTLRIPDTLLYFNGHFPGNPVLPGVVQIDWAIKFALELFGEPGDFVRLERLKFQHIIQPGAVITLSLLRDEAKSSIQFIYASAVSVYSSGRVVFKHYNG